MNRDEALRLLKSGEEGIAEWNRRLQVWRPNPDLNNANLNGAYLRGLDLLIGANLREAFLRRAYLSRADLPGQT